MKIIEATIIDETHLELSQPIEAQVGEIIRISIPDQDDDEAFWKEAAKQRFLDAYSDEDSIYDNL